MAIPLKSKALTASRAQLLHAITVKFRNQVIKAFQRLGNEGSNMSGLEEAQIKFELLDL